MTKKAELLKQELEIGVTSGQLKNRDQLCSFISNELGLTITRKGSDYLSVKFPATTKAVRLKGSLFEEATNYERLASPNSQKSRSVLLTDLEYKTHNQSLSHLLQKRGQSLAGLPICNSITTKEAVNGKTQPRERGSILDTTNHPHRGSIEPSRRGAEYMCGKVVRHEGNAGRSTRDQYPNPKPIHKLIEEARHYPRGGGIGRNWGEGSIRERASNNGGGIQATIEANSNKKSGQHSGINEEPKSSEWISTGLMNYGATAGDINEQIRKLTIALQTASFNSQSVIQNQIKELVGKREHLPRPK